MSNLKKLFLFSFFRTVSELSDTTLLILLIMLPKYLDNQLTFGVIILVILAVLVYVFKVL